MKYDLNSSEFYAKNITEAVRIAEELSKNGISDLFRGQTNNWRPQPSLFRLGIDKEVEFKRLNKFANWISNVQELTSLHNNKEQILAVAQHYGIGTTFLDFTRNPKVAGFFATHNYHFDKNEENQGVIICLSKNVFIDSWMDINERALKSGKVSLTRLIEIEVNNLWRMQSQEGVFLDIRVAPDFLEMFSFFRYIYFTHNSTQYNLIKETTIYPPNKSHVEILIDEFFEHETRQLGIARAEEFFGKAIYINDNNYEGDTTAFINNVLPNRLSSWEIKSIKDWLHEPKEVYSDLKNNPIVNISLKSLLTIPEQKAFIKQQLFEIENKFDNPRTQNITWKINDEDGKTLLIDDEDADLLEGDKIPQIECNKVVSILWDGLRRLPYSNEQLFDCISSYLIGAKYEYSGLGKIFGRMTGVEFSTNIAINRSSVSEKLLLSSIRKDFWQTIDENEKKKNIRTDGHYVLSILFDPKRLFEFPDFVNIFVRNVIPIQPFCSSFDKIIFSPARIEVFGLS